MENCNINAGQELFSLLRHQRYLYHELAILTARKQQLAKTNSPELMLEVINGRRKLVEKLHDVNSKLRPIRAKWFAHLSQIEPAQMKKANEMAEEVQRIVARISAANKGSTADSPLNKERKSEKKWAQVIA